MVGSDTIFFPILSIVYVDTLNIRAGFEGVQGPHYVISLRAFKNFINLETALARVTVLPRAEYCCKGEFSSPKSCQPTAYSQVFKTACPRSYSYAYDDATSTFTCTGADYVITFCPSLPSSSDNYSGTGKGLKKPMNTSSSSPLEGLFSNSSLYADLATGDATTINQHRSRLALISFIPSL
ncbi:thaumatin-like protein 1, partial [Tanacetum coccineum]